VTATDGTVQDPRPGAVLVTGGASGLGAAIALAVQAAGGRPFVLDLVTPPFAVDHELVDLADLPEAALLATWGGQAVVLPDLEGRSTTQLMKEVVRRDSH
jgi:NAD(P)-dependent dehydrogenase (short-subunit alcohol dehydrogenase family)